jgi:hypothetical protein
MSTPYEDYQKTGLKKMIELAKVLCRLVQTFEVIIRAKFPDSVPIIALLDAIAVLCTLIPAADADFQAYALVTTPMPEDAAEIAGIDPTAPPAEDPDLV